MFRHQYAVTFQQQYWEFRPHVESIDDCSRPEAPWTDTHLLMKNGGHYTDPVVDSWRLLTTHFVNVSWKSMVSCLYQFKQISLNCLFKSNSTSCVVRMLLDLVNLHLLQNTFNVRIYCLQDTKK